MLIQIHGRNHRFHGLSFCEWIMTALVFFINHEPIAGVEIQLLTPFLSPRMSVQQQMNY